MTARIIHKYSVRHGEFTIELPKGSEVLCVQVQDGFPKLWVLIKDVGEMELRRFVVVGTGWKHNLPKSAYIGTYQEPPFVWHVFEL